MSAIDAECNLESIRRKNGQKWPQWCRVMDFPKFGTIDFFINFQDFPISINFRRNSFLAPVGPKGRFGWIFFCTSKRKLKRMLIEMPRGWGGSIRQPYSDRSFGGCSEPPQGPNPPNCQNVQIWPQITKIEIFFLHRGLQISISNPEFA